MTKVERDRLLATIERLEEERVAVARVGAGRARAVALRDGVLDLDDLGPEVGEELRPERPRAELIDRENAQPCERRARAQGSFPSPSVGWLRLGTSAVRRNVITRTPFWLLTRVSTLTMPRSPFFDSRSASTVDSE